MAKKSKTRKIYKYTCFFEPATEGGYVVSVPALPGCVTQGESFEEARSMIKDAIKGYIAVLRDDGDSIPVEREEIITAPVYIPIQVRT